MERADRRSEERVWEMVCCSVEGKCRSDKDTGNGSEVPMVDGLEKRPISEASDREENDRKKEGFLRIIDQNNFHGGVDWYNSWIVANQLTDCILW